MKKRRKKRKEIKNSCLEVHFFSLNSPPLDFSLLLPFATFRKPLCAVASKVKFAKIQAWELTQSNIASSAACNDRTSMTSYVCECGALVTVPCISSKYQRLSGTHKLSNGSQMLSGPFLPAIVAPFSFPLLIGSGDSD